MRPSSLDRPKIEVRGLRYGAGGAEILAGVDALVPDGEITAVVGPSGAGKSTLLRAINRLIEPTSGEVYLDGEPTRSLDPLELRRRVGMVFQIPALFGDSVEDADPLRGAPRRQGRGLPAVCSRWWVSTPRWRGATRRPSPSGSSSASP